MKIIFEISTGHMSFEDQLKGWLNGETYERVRTTWVDTYIITLTPLSNIHSLFMMIGERISFAKVVE